MSSFEITGKFGGDGVEESGNETVFRRKAEGSFSAEVHSKAGKERVKKEGDKEGSIDREEEEDEVGEVEEGCLGIGEERGTREKKIVPKRESMVVKKLVFDEVDERPKEFLQVVTATYKK